MEINIKQQLVIWWLDTKIESIGSGKMKRLMVCSSQTSDGYNDNVNIIVDDIAKSDFSLPRRIREKNPIYVDNICIRSGSCLDDVLDILRRIEVYARGTTLTNFEMICTNYADIAKMKFSIEVDKDKEHSDMIPDMELYSCLASKPVNRVEKFDNFIKWLNEEYNFAENAKLGVPFIYIEGPQRVQYDIYYMIVGYRSELKVTSKQQSNGSVDKVREVIKYTSQMYRTLPQAKKYRNPICLEPSYISFRSYCGRSVASILLSGVVSQKKCSKEFGTDMYQL